MLHTHNKHLLLVEDQVIIAMNVMHSLAEYGYQTTHACSAEEAIRCVKEMPELDLILMDIDLGEGMDGTEAAAIILQRREIPIVFLSSHTEPEIVAKTEKITSYGYVVKFSVITVLDASIKMAFKLFEANQQMKLAKDKLKATLDALPDLLFEVGLDGTIHDYHSPRAELLYVPATEIIGKKVQELMPSDTVQIIIAALMKANEAGFSTGHQYELHVSAGRLWFELSVVRKSHDSTERRFIALAKNITKRKSIEAALNASEKRYYDLLENIETGIVIHAPDTSIILNNPRASKILGLSDEQMRGKTAIDPNWRFVDTEGNALSLTQYPVNKILQGRQALKEYVIGIIKNDGSPTVWVRVNGYPNISAENEQITEVIVSFIDITSLKNIEVQLQKQSNLLTNILYHLPVSVFGKDVQKGFQFSLWNKKSEELFGIASEQILGKQDYELFPKEQADFFSVKDTEACKSTGVIDIPEEAAGDKLLHTRKIVIRDSDGEPTVLLGISEDITERKKSEEKIVNLLAEKELILQEVHHRIKNNMTTLAALLSIQANTMQDKAAIEALNDAANRVKSMMVLYDKLYLTEFSGQMQASEYIYALLDEIMKNFPQSQSLQVVKQMEDFALNPHQLQPLGILINELITNIMKYAFLDRKDGTISIKATRLDNHVTLIVEDNGRGFTTADTSKGFGMMLVQMLTKQLRGSLQILSSEGGTKVVLEFPL